MAGFFSKFGFSFKEKDKQVPQPILPRNEETSFDFVNPGFGYSGITSSVVTAHIQSDNALIERYRNVSEMPEVDNAIEEIIAECVVIDGETDPVILNLDSLDYTDTLKKKIQDSFSEVMHLLNFRNTGHDMFKRFYIDGRMYFYMQTDENKTKKGLTKIEAVDPRKIKPVREIELSTDSMSRAAFAPLYKVKEEYYVYSESMVDNQYGSYYNAMPQQQSLIRIEKDSVAHATSGLTDSKGNTIYSYLQKCLRVANQVKWLEDAILIYYLSRAPSRRAFYISTMNVPKPKRESFMREVMARFKQEVYYDPSTGDLKDNRKLMSLQDDYWIPRDDSGNTTEIKPIDGSSNLSDMNIPLNDFRQKLLKSLNVPIGRLDPSSSLEFSMSATEVTRDELKFSRFISRLRSRFTMIFDEALKAQLVLKGVISADNWDELKEGLKYVFTTENHFTELRDTELLSKRLSIAENAVPMIGKFFTLEQIQKRVMKMTDEDIKEVSEYDEKFKVDRDGNITPADEVMTQNGIELQPRGVRPSPKVGIPIKQKKMKESNEYDMTELLERHGL